MSNIPRNINQLPSEFSLWKPKHKCLLCKQHLFGWPQIIKPPVCKQCASFENLSTNSFVINKWKIEIKPSHRNKSLLVSRNHNLCKESLIVHFNKRIVPRRIVDSQVIYLPEIIMTFWKRNPILPLDKEAYILDMANILVNMYELESYSYIDGFDCTHTDLQWEFEKLVFLLTAAQVFDSVKRCQISWLVAKENYWKLFIPNISGHTILHKLIQARRQDYIQVFCKILFIILPYFDVVTVCFQIKPFLKTVLKMVPQDKIEDFKMTYLSFFIPSFFLNSNTITFVNFTQKTFVEIINKLD